MCALTSIVLLEPGEAADSERVIRAIGPNVMASVYYFYDAVHERGIEPPPFLRRIWKRYCALVEENAGRAPALPHPRGPLHLPPPGRGGADRRRPGARHLPGGRAEELVERIQELERGGLRELMWATGTDEKWRFSQQLADRVMARLCPEHLPLGRGEGLQSTRLDAEVALEAGVVLLVAQLAAHRDPLLVADAGAPRGRGLPRRRRPGSAGAAGRS